MTSPTPQPPPARGGGANVQTPAGEYKIRPYENVPKIKSPPAIYRQEGFLFATPAAITVAGYIWHPSLQWDTGLILKCAVHIRSPPFSGFSGFFVFSGVMIILPP